MGITTTEWILKAIKEDYGKMWRKIPFEQQMAIISNFANSTARAIEFLRKVHDTATRHKGRN
jgi:hypothetical protein